MLPLPRVLLLALPLLLSGCRQARVPAWVVLRPSRPGEPARLLLLPGQSAPAEPWVAGRDLARRVQPAPASELPLSLPARLLRSLRGERCPDRALPLPSAPAYAVVALDRPGAAELRFQRPPALPGPLVAKARLRLQELAWHLHDQGQEGFDPRHAAARSLYELHREHAPPLLAVAGDADCLGLVALLDHRARELLAWDALPLPGPRCAPLAALPPAPLEGAGPALLAYAGHGGGTGTLRALYRLAPAEARRGLALDEARPSPALERAWVLELPGDCPGLEPGQEPQGATP